MSISKLTTQAALKGCACCHRDLHSGDYSNTQLMIKVKRQCKICVAGIQLIPIDQRQDAVFAKQDFKQNFGLHVSKEMEPGQFYCLLNHIISQLPNHNRLFNVGNIGLNTQLVVGLLRVVQTEQTEHMLSLALQYITCICKIPSLLAQMVMAGAIPILLNLLRQRDQRSSSLSKVGISYTVQIISIIAKSTSNNCDELLLTSGALNLLLSFIQTDTSLDLRIHLSSAIIRLMQGRQSLDDIKATVNRIGLVLMDETAPMEIHSFCINILLGILKSIPDKNKNQIFDTWVDSIMTTSPGISKRLVELMLVNQVNDDDGVCIDLVALLFYSNKSSNMIQLFNHGLVDKLQSIYKDGNKTTSFSYWVICFNSTIDVEFASLFMDSEMLQIILMVVFMGDNEKQENALSILCNMIYHRDRRITRKFINTQHAVPTIITTLSHAIENANWPTVTLCLRVISDALIVGDEEAAEDPRNINPYIESFNWVATFDIVKPLQNNACEDISILAKHVLGYSISERCE